MKALIALLAFGIAAAVGVADYDAAVVKIYTKTSEGPGQGTGAFVSPAGKILTAYHVVQGASELWVWHDTLGSFKDIRVEAVSGAHDIAVLQIIKDGLTTPFVPMDLTEPSTDTDLVLVGYTLGIAKQTFKCHATRSGFVRSRQVRDVDRKAVFAEDIDLITLDVTAYDGLSGGPVIGPKGMVGVFSGSIQEGGTVAWAVPCKYARRELPHRVGTLPRDRPTWPALSLMAPRWQKPVLRLSRNPSRFLDELRKYRTQFDDAHVAMRLCAVETLADSHALRIRAGKVAEGQADGATAAGMVAMLDKWANMTVEFNTRREEIDSVLLAQNAICGDFLSWTQYQLEQGVRIHGDGFDTAMQEHERFGKALHDARGVLELPDDALNRAIDFRVRLAEIQAANDDDAGEQMADAIADVVAPWVPYLESFARGEANAFFEEFGDAEASVSAVYEAAIERARDE